MPERDPLFSCIVFRGDGTAFRGVLTHENLEIIDNAGGLENVVATTEDASSRSTEEDRRSWIVDILVPSSFSSEIYLN